MRRGLRRGAGAGALTVAEGMTRAAVLGVALAFAFPPAAHGDPIRVTCTFSESALAALDNDRKIGLTLDTQEPMTVTIDDLDTDFPTLSFSVGPARTQGGRLEVIRREVGLIWLAQSPQQGQVNFWTIFLKQKTALLSRHFVQDVTTLQRPVGIMTMGSCD